MVAGRLRLQSVKCLYNTKTSCSLINGVFNPLDCEMVEFEIFPLTERVDLVLGDYFRLRLACLVKFDHFNFQITLEIR